MDLSRPEKILEEERRTVQEFLYEEYSQERFMELDEELKQLVNVNNRIFEIAEASEKADPIGEYHALRRAEALKEKTESDLTAELNRLAGNGDFPGKPVIQKVRKLQNSLDNVEQQVVEEKKKEAFQHAKDVIDARPVFVFDSEVLNRFLSHVEREQLGNGNECWGWFTYTERGQSYYLDKYVPMKTFEASSTSISTRDETKQVIREKGNQQNILHAHSHPQGEIGHSPYQQWSHSGQDKGVIMDERNFDLDGFNGHAGVIGKPSENKGFWVIAQMWDSYGQFKNCPVKVKGDTPARVQDYNKAIVKAVLHRNEEEWIRYTEE